MLTDMNIYKLTVFLEFETKNRQNLINNESFAAVTHVAEIHTTRQSLNVSGAADFGRNMRLRELSSALAFARATLEQGVPTKYFLAIVGSCVSGSTRNG